MEYGPLRSCDEDGIIEQLSFILVESVMSVQAFRTKHNESRAFGFSGGGARLYLHR